MGGEKDSCKNVSLAGSLGFFLDFYCGNSVLGVKDDRSKVLLSGSSDNTNRIGSGSGLFLS